MKDRDVPTSSPVEETDRALLTMALYYGLLLVVLLAAFWPFVDMLGYYFTKTETGGVLHSARIFSPQDLLDILTRSIKNRFNPRSIYFRPSMTLSFSLDYALWGFNPTGYHLTDLLLHMAVAGLLFRVVYLFNGREVWSAALAGLTYTLHPILMEVVPAVVHRQETLMASFLLLGLWGFYRREYENGGWVSLGVALAAFVISVGGKESGIIFVPLVLTHLWIFNPDGANTVWDRVWATLRRGIPYLVTAGLYVGWWMFVTRSRALLGGGKTFKRPVLRGSWWKTLYEQFVVFPDRNIPFYFEALLQPFHALYERVTAVLYTLLFPLRWYVEAGEGSWIVAVLILVAVFVWVGTRLSRFWSSVSGTDTVRERLLAGNQVVMSLLVAGLVAFPLYSPWIEWVVHEAYRGQAFPWLTAMMDSRGQYSAADYVLKAQFRLLAGVVGLLVVSFFLQAYYSDWWTRSFARGRRFMRRVVPFPAPLAFYITWLFMPALFYSVTNIRSFKHTYHGVPPFGALLGTLLVGGVVSCAQATKTNGSWSRGISGLLGGLMVIVAGVHFGGLARVSPLRNEYPAWDHGQQVTRMYHRMLFHELPKLPVGSLLELRGVPRWTGKREEYPHFNFVSPAMHPKPWIMMRFKEYEFEVGRLTLRAFPEPCPCSFWLEKRQLGSHSFGFVTHRGRPSSLPPSLRPGLSIRFMTDGDRRSTNSP